MSVYRRRLFEDIFSGSLISFASHMIKLDVRSVLGW